MINQLNNLIGKMNANERGQVTLKLLDCSLAFTPGISMKIDKDFTCIMISNDSSYYVIPIDKITYIEYKDSVPNLDTEVRSQVENIRN